MLDVALELEEVALKDRYFVERKLYPNVDFYSGIIYKALKIPTEMFTVMFAIARTAGWVAHWLEQHGTADSKIGRPRQVYTGRDHSAITCRSPSAERLLAWQRCGGGGVTVCMLLFPLDAQSAGQSGSRATWVVR